MDPSHSSPPSSPSVHPESQTQLPFPDTLQTPLLRTYGLVVNTSHQILICLACQGIIDPLHVRKHFLKYHKTTKTPLDLQILLNEDAEKEYPNLTSSPPHPTTPIPPIYGLQDPVWDYLMCTTCNHCFASKKTLGKHSSCTAGSPWIVTAAQRFLKNTSKPWFPVQTPLPPPSDTTSRWAVYQSQLTSDTSSTEPSYSDDFRVLHQFLHGERWLERVEGSKHEELIPIAVYSTSDPVYGGIHSHISALLSKIQLHLDEPFIRRSIGSRPAEEKEQVRIKYHKDVNQTTLDHYARIVASMICLIHRVILDVNLPYTFSMPSTIVDACKDFISTRPSAVSNNKTQVDQQALDEDETLELSESSEDEDSPRILLEASASAQATTPSNDPTLANFLYLLYTQLPSPQFHGQFFTPIYHFLLLSAIRKNQEWAAANTITQTIAALLFTGRLIFAWKVNQLIDESNIDSTQAFHNIAKFFEESSGAIMPRLYVTKRGFTGLQSAEEGTIFFNAPDLSGNSAIIGGKTVYLSDIKSTHERAMEEIEKELDSLTFHSPQFTLTNDVLIHDSPRERAPGYSFLKHPDNQWNHRPTVIQHIMESDTLFSQYAHFGPSGTISWNHTAISKGIKQIYDLQLKILCNIILSYGEPARGTELASHLLANVSGGSIRNFFVLFNIPVLRASFSKTTYATGDKVIYRVPLPRLGRQFVRFLAYLRPLFIEWQGYLNQPMVDNAKLYLFPGLHRPLTSNDISAALSKYTMQEIGISMKLHLYRQYMAFITSCNQGVFEAASLTSSATHAQFGHTKKINVQHYGQDARTPDGINFSSFLSAARVSGVFHVLYGHPPDLLQQLERNQAHINKIKNTINQVWNPALPSISTTLPSTVSLEEITESVKSAILSEIKSTMIQSIATALSNPGDSETTHSHVEK